MQEQKRQTPQQEQKQIYDRSVQYQKTSKTSATERGIFCNMGRGAVAKQLRIPDILLQNLYPILKFHVLYNCILYKNMLINIITKRSSCSISYIKT